MNRQSVSQYERMTSVPVHRLVSRLAVPTVLSMLITSIYNLADTAFVGMIGTSASAAVAFGRFFLFLQKKSFHSLVYLELKIYLCRLLRSVKIFLLAEGNH